MPLARRTVVTPLLMLALACGSENSMGSGPDPDPDPDPQGETYTITVPEFTIEPGGEVFKCYHTTLPVEEARAVTRYSSQMSEGSHHMILFYVKQPQRPDGTLEDCQGGPGGSGTDVPIWAYASQDPEGEMRLPEGVAVPLEAQQAVVVNLHYYNLGDAPIDANVNIQIETLPAGATYQAAHAFVTFNDQIAVPPGEAATFGGTCDVPAGAKFVSMTTHSHRYTTAARVFDGDAMVLETLDWAHATVETWSDQPFLEFTSGQLRYECDYLNDTNVMLTVGESALATEMCLAGGFYFPADTDLFCLNSTVLSF